ncbi:hypothetical protein TgHK011_002496 [Trichoderma gracile]|nr:hypothetical protein TgHK011_002496 [Trichoderma gracile]
MSISNNSALLTSLDDTMPSQAGIQKNRGPQASRRPPTGPRRQQSTTATNRMVAKFNTPVQARLFPERIREWFSKKVTQGAAVVGNSAADGAFQSNAAVRDGDIVALNEATGSKTRQRNKTCNIM